jgi:hypothetical protein
MRGKPEFNFPAFHAYASRLRAQGYEVFSPAEQDIARHRGVDISKGNEKGDPEQAYIEHGFSVSAALREDLNYICDHADGIAMMPGWETSLGAFAEHAVARALHKRVFYLEPL